MAYATLEQLKDRLGTTIYARLTDRVSGATADDSVGQALLDQAEAEANSRLSVRFASPIDVASFPEIATALAERVLDLAEWLAWRGSPFVADLPERVRLVGDSAEAWFRDIVSGRIALPGATPLPGPTAVSDAPLFAATTRTLTPEELDGL